MAGVIFAKQKGGGGSPGGSPGGSDTQIQFNDSGSFGGNENFTWNNTDKILTVKGSTNDGVTLDQRWQDSDGNVVAYIASNGDTYIKFLTISDWAALTGFVKVTSGILSVSSSVFSEITITGTIDNSNTTFTASSEPQYLVINGGWYKPTGGSITWEYSAGTIELSKPVGENGQIWGF